jgi:rare lipoprotein A
MLRLVAAVLVAALAGCTSAPPKIPTPQAPATAPVAPPSPPSSRYYADDGPPDRVPEDIDAIPDAVPRTEPLHRFANRPYVVMGRQYVPATTLRPYRERGVASWYGRKFHGQKTSIGEVYDMFAMTAAHPTLPLPSYARVTNVATGRSVVVRVNDRGPFLHGRVIDLSYAAAHRIGVAQKGSGEVEVEAILPPAVSVATAPLPPVDGSAPATTPAAVVAEAPAAAGAAGGFIVQLGAFANYANAQAFLAHVQNQTTHAGVEPRVRQAGSLWRVYVGPYAERDEAVRTAERIASAFGLATSVRAH